MDIKNIYDTYANLSYIDKNNFYGKLFPEQISSLFIKCSDLKNFYNDTYIFLHLFSSLFFELYKYNNNNNNDITLFSNLITLLKIEINYDTSNNDIGILDTINKKFIFNLYAVKTHTTTLYYINPDDNIQKYIKPILNNIETINTNDDFTLNGLYSISNSFEYDLSSLKNLSNIRAIRTSYYTIYNNESRKNKLINVIYDILSQPTENIMSYILYYKIYFHIILYNIVIQSTIRYNYLNNDSLIISNNSSITSIQESIKTVFNNMIYNINELNNNCLNFKNNDYIVDKYKYIKKIAKLNAIRDEYIRIENNLNNTMREYNKYIINYKKIKNYGTFVIIILIMIIISTILITLLGNIDKNFKNNYYLIAFIVLSIITYIYYNNFKHINLYEKFEIINNNCNNNLLYNKNRLSNLKNHVAIYNYILSSMNEYSDKIKEIFDSLRTNIYTVGSKTFSQDANIYLDNLYKEKFLRNKANRIRQISLSNLVETIKKQVLYLFNIILIISLLILILLFGLVLYVNFPFFLTYIIILCTILIIIIIIYFIISIIQPTRMITNKNYWANQNPSKELLVRIK